MQIFIKHGNHYHRVGCTDYKRWVGNDGIEVLKEDFNPECSKCKESKTKQCCPRPESIKEFL